MSVSSEATSIIGRFSLYAFLAISAAFLYPMIGLRAVTSMGFLAREASILFLLTLNDLMALLHKTSHAPERRLMLLSKL